MVWGAGSPHCPNGPVIVNPSAAAHPSGVQRDVRGGHQNTKGPPAHCAGLGCGRGHTTDPSIGLSYP